MRFAIVLLILCSQLSAQGLPKADRRYADIRHTDFVFEMPVYESDSEWQLRASYLRRQILWTAGLDPLPARTDLNPRISSPLVRDGYTIENVLLETSPGFFLGGNLYRPTTPAQPRSAVLLSHGHWTYGRLENSERASPPTLAANLALQGHIVFAYDMVGYNDTAQFPHAALGASREDLWNVNLLGLQLWNSIRALDFLESLSDVDPSRIYAAGASGGATQAVLLTAIDQRISAAALVNMISFHMQGGDVCENAPGLRIDTNNVEFAALVAPRPLLLVSATGDWTVNTLTQEFPAVRGIYNLLGQRDNVRAVQFDAPHNFNQQSRKAVYSFFSDVGGNSPAAITEKTASIPQPSQLLALWSAARPSNALLDSAAFVGERTAQAAPASRERLQLALQVALPAASQLHTEISETWQNGEYFAVGRSGKGDRIPGALLRPRRIRDWVKPTLIIHPEGSAWTMSSAESRDGFVSNVLSRGGSVMAVDVFQTGHARGERDIAAAGARAETYFTTYNRTDTALRVQDILTAIAFAQQQFETDQIQLICPDEAGLWCSLARAFLDTPIDTVVDWQHFNANNNDAYVEHLFVPGMIKAGGLNAAIQLWPGGRTAIFNANESFPTAADADAPNAVLNTGSLDWDQLLEWTAPRRRPN
jgi:dienelactone hydrolase